MAEQDERTGEWIPRDSRLRHLRLWIERACLRRATRLVFCTEGARQICLCRHGQSHADKCVVTANGFDEAIFSEVECELTPTVRAATTPITLVHSGIIYASADRDPSAFLQAVGTLKQNGA